MILEGNVIRLILFILVLIQFSLNVCADENYSGENGKFIDYFKQYYSKTREQPGQVSGKRSQIKENPQILEQLREHRKSYNAYSKIAVLDVKSISPQTKRIHYYYQSWYKNTFPKSFWVTISKNRSGNQFSVISLRDSDFELEKYLKGYFRKSYRKMKREFSRISHRRLKSLKIPRKLKITNARPINSIYLNPIHYNAARINDSEYFPLYSLRYERGVVGYLMHTPQCYGKPRSGLVLFVVNEKKLQFEFFGRRSYFDSRILINEPQCTDAEEKWSTQGFFVDVNNDGYIDIVVRHKFKKRKKRRSFRMRTHYYQYTYRGKGRYRFRRISGKKFNRLIYARAR